MEEDLSAYIDQHGKRFYSNEVPEKWRYLKLEYSSVVWAKYETFPFWPALVVGFQLGDIKIHFFPRTHYTSVYNFSRVETVRELQSMTLDECRQLVQSKRKAGYSMREFNNAINELKDFIDVELDDEE